MKWTLIILFLMIVPSALAYQGPFNPNTPIELYSNCIKEESGGSSFLASTQNLTIRHLNGSIYKSSSAMIPYDDGRFSLNVTFNQSGSYLLEKRCIDANGTVAVGGDVAEVININEEVENLALFGLMVLFVVGVLLMLVAYKYGVGVLHIVAGIWFIGVGASMAGNLFGGVFSLGMLFLALLGFYAIWEGYTDLMSAKKLDNS